MKLLLIEHRNVIIYNLIGFLFFITLFCLPGCVETTKYIYVQTPPKYIKAPDKISLDHFNGTRTDSFGNILVNEKNIISVTSYIKELEAVNRAYENQTNTNSTNNNK